MVTNVSDEHSSSELKFMKKRTKKWHDTTNNLSLVCTENDILENTDFNDIIHDFAMSKCRETPM
jgi:hypothetical protein